MSKSGAKRVYGIYKIQEFCENRIPKGLKNKMKMGYKTEGNKITIIEQRPSFTGEATWTQSPVVQIRYNQKKENWTIYSRDRNQKWHLYTEIEPKEIIEEIIEEIEADPTGIFWG
jgi:hypothetical protein